MFRSPNDVTSTSDASSSSEEEVGRSTRPAGSQSLSEVPSNLIGSALEHQETASESIEGDRTGPSGHEASWVPSSTNVHASMVTAASLEFMYTQIAAERLNAEHGVTTFTRHSAEAKERGRQMYMQTSQQLASAGVVSGETGDHFLRQQYAMGLEQLGTRGLDTSSNLNADITNQLGNQGPQPTASSLLLAPGNLDQNSFIGPAPLPPHNFQFTPAGLPRSSVQSNLSQMSIPRPPPTRYRSEFQELQALGRGGYGTVYHVVNFVDNQHYAIKKIPLNSRLLRKWRDGGKKEIEKILKEIRTLARLDHQNIVRYYGAWIEHQQSTAPVNQRNATNARGFHSSSSSSPLVMRPNAPGTIMEQDIIFEVSSEQENDARGKVEEISDGNDIIFGFSNESQSNSEHADPGPSNTRNRRESQATTRSTLSRKSYVQSTGSEGDEVEEVESSHKTDNLSLDQTSTLGFANSDDVFTDGNAAPNSQLIKRGQHDTAEAVVLHIQMSLHPLSLIKYLQTAPPTPSDPLKVRHCFHVRPSLKLILAIIDGVEYLHTQGVVHRDLKPGNIFLSAHDMFSGGCVEVGNCPDCLSGSTTAETPQQRSRYVTPRIGDFGLVAEIISNATDTSAPATTAAGSAPPESSNPINTPQRRTDTAAPDQGPTILNSPIDLALSALTLSPPRPSRLTKKPSAAPRVVGTEFYRPPPTPAATAAAAPAPSSRTHQASTSASSTPASPSAKLDVFALGVILFELLYPFSTRMERMMVLKALTDASAAAAASSSSSSSKLPDDFPAGAGGAGGRVTNTVRAKLRACVLGMVDADADARWGLGDVRACLAEVAARLEE